MLEARMTSDPHVVIVGAGFAGLAAARALRKALVRVTVIDRHNHHVFQPLLYQVATAGLSPAEIAAPIRWILRRQRNVRVLLADVARVEPEARQVVLTGGDVVSYDALVVATGVTHAYFGHDEWAARAPGLKTLDDAVAIRRRVLLAFERAEREADPARQRELLTFVVIGGGPTGVEMAGAIAEIARQSLADEFDAITPQTARVVLLEGGPTILATYSEPLRASARQALTSLGVEVRERSIVTGLDAQMVHVGDERIAAGTVVWAAGVQASPLGRTLGAPVDRLGRVEVLPDLSVPGHPEVFVAGDLMMRPDAGGQPIPGVAQAAMQAGRAAAANVLRVLRGEATKPFTYRDPGSMATIGRARAIADLGWITLTGYPAWLAWLFLHLVFLIGFKNRLVVLVQWLTAYITRQRGVRLITGHDESPDGG
jgi:NADH:ubiquinone reductase (H+-translocating)